MDSSDNALTVEVYVRPQQLTDPINTKIDAVQQFESAGHIDNVLIHAWPKSVTLSERTPSNNAAIGALEQMEAWAEQHGISIRPPFNVRTTTSSFTGETLTKLRTPVLCLAVYVGARLANVFPHSRGEDRYTVRDGIIGLKTGEIDLFPVTHDLSESSSAATQYPRTR